MEPEQQNRVLGHNISASQGGEVNSSERCAAEILGPGEHLRSLAVPLAPEIQTDAPSAVTDLISTFQSFAPQSGVDANFIRLVAESPTSPIACEIWERLPELESAGVSVTAVFAKLPGNSTSEEAIKKMVETYGPLAAFTSIRVAHGMKVQKMFEQATFGGQAVWMGNRMNGGGGTAPRAGELTMIGDDERSRQIASIARVGFAGLWKNAETLRALPRWRKLCLKMLAEEKPGPRSLLVA